MPSSWQHRVGEQIQYSAFYVAREYFIRYHWVARVGLRQRVPMLQLPSRAEVTALTQRLSERLSERQQWETEADSIRAGQRFSDLT